MGGWVGGRVGNTAKAAALMAAVDPIQCGARSALVPLHNKHVVKQSAKNVSHPVHTCMAAMDSACCDTMRRRSPISARSLTMTRRTCGWLYMVGVG
jgi:hypothetical protein